MSWLIVLNLERMFNHVESASEICCDLQEFFMAESKVKSHKFEKLYIKNEER